MHNIYSIQKRMNIDCIMIQLRWDVESVEFWHLLFDLLQGLSTTIQGGANRKTP